MKRSVILLKLFIVSIALFENAYALPFTPRRALSSATIPRSGSNIPTNLLGRSFHLQSIPANTDKASRSGFFREEEPSRRWLSIHQNEDRGEDSESSTRRKRLNYRMAKNRLQDIPSKSRGERRSRDGISGSIQKSDSQETKSVEQNILLSHSGPGPATPPPNDPQVTPSQASTSSPAAPPAAPLTEQDREHAKKPHAADKHDTSTTPTPRNSSSALAAGGEGKRKDKDHSAGKEKKEKAKEKEKERKEKKRKERERKEKETDREAGFR